MKVNNISNQTFYGYKNVITGENIPIDDKKVTFVSGDNSIQLLL